MNYIFKHTKKYFLSAVMLLLMVSSCSEDLLKEKPLDFLAPESAYTNVSGIRQGITGLHQAVRDYWYASNDEQYPMTFGDGTDICYYGEAPGGATKLANYLIEMTPQNDRFSAYWDRNYIIIQRSNVLIEAIKSSDLSIWTNEAQKNAFLAEAMFFRAYAYRMLVALYGDVPLVTEPTKTVKTDYVRAPKADVYKLMEDDLKFGVANLPIRGKEEAAGRITQGAAGHFLTECYNAQGKYQQAVDAATVVINNSGYALMTARFGTTKQVFGTGDVLLDLFAYGNHNLAANKEAIWVIQIEPIVIGGSQFAGERAWGCRYFSIPKTPDNKNAFSGQPANPTYLDTLGRPVAWNRPTSFAAYFMWKDNWKNDIRNAPHHIKRDFYYDSPTSTYHKKKIDLKTFGAGRPNMDDTCRLIFPYFMKHADPLNHFVNLVQAGGGYTHKDAYAARLAETILLRAEAYIGLKTAASDLLAVADINLIRSRAQATQVTLADIVQIETAAGFTSDHLLHYMLDERARELYAEDMRHITLRRTGKLLERVRKYCDNPVFPACNIQDKNVLFPIPQKMIDLNIGSKMLQNLGY